MIISTASAGSTGALTSQIDPISSIAGSISTKEFNEFIRQNEMEEKVQSTFHINPTEDRMQIDAPEESFHLPEYDEPTEDSIHLADFTGAEIQSPKHTAVDYDKHTQQAEDDESSKNIEQSSNDGTTYEEQSDYTYRIPRQVYVATAAETSENAANRQPVEYPCAVTLPDGITTVDISAETAVKNNKIHRRGHNDASRCISKRVGNIQLLQLAGVATLETIQSNTRRAKKTSKHIKRT